MIRITPQFYKSRRMTYAIYFNDVFCGFAHCFCKAKEAAEILFGEAERLKCEVLRA